MKKNLFLWVTLLCLSFTVTAQDKVNNTSQTLFKRASTLYSGTRIAREGAWCWFADPRALHYENAQGTINASYIGYIDVHGAVKATQYNFLTGRRSEVLIRSYFQPDDHNNPTFLVLPDERIMIFYSRHTDEACFYYRVSRLPGDITTLGEEKVLKTKNNTTYPSPFILSDDPSHIYLCWRGINWHPTIAQLTLPDADDNVSFSWGPHQMVQSSGARPYAKYHSNGKDRIFMTYTTGHPDNEPTNWLYFNAININTKQLEDVSGRVLSTIADGPMRVTRQDDYAQKNPLCVVDHSPGKRDWVWQLATGKQGEPVIAMTRISGDKTQHDYYYARWNGKQWSKTFLAHGGGHFHNTRDIERCYSGGMAIDPAFPHHIVCSEPVAGAFGKKYELVEYVVEDGKVTHREQITFHSSLNNARPYILPHSEKSPLRLTWMNGNYYDWIVSKQRPGYPTAIHGHFTWNEPAPALNQGLLQHLEGAAAGKALKLKADKKSTTTIVYTFQANDSLPVGTIIEGNNWSWSIQADKKPIMKVGKNGFASQNILGSADSWLDYGRGTNGKWYAPRMYKKVNLILEISPKGIITYINGLLDQNIPAVAKLKSIQCNTTGVQPQAVRIYNRALTASEIEALQQ